MDKLLIDNVTLTKLREYEPTEDAVDAMANFFSSLSDNTRVRIITALSISPMCVSDLSNVLQLNQTTISHQLKNLKDIGVLRMKRQGKICFYSIKDNKILDIMMSAANFINN